MQYSMVDIRISSRIGCPQQPLESPCFHDFSHFPRTFKVISEILCAHMWKAQGQFRWGHLAICYNWNKLPGWSVRAPNEPVNLHLYISRNRLMHIHGYGTQSMQAWASAVRLMLRERLCFAPWAFWPVSPALGWTMFKSLPLPQCLAHWSAYKCRMSCCSSAQRKQVNFLNDLESLDANFLVARSSFQ